MRLVTVGQAIDGSVSAVVNTSSSIDQPSIGQRPKWRRSCVVVVPHAKQRNLPSLFETTRSDWNLTMPPRESHIAWSVENIRRASMPKMLVGVLAEAIDKVSGATACASLTASTSGPTGAADAFALALAFVFGAGATPELGAFSGAAPAWARAAAFPFAFGVGAMTSPRNCTGAARAIALDVVFAFGLGATVCSEPGSTAAPALAFAFPFAFGAGATAPSKPGSGSAPALALALPFALGARAATPSEPASGAAAALAFVFATALDFPLGCRSTQSSRVHWDACVKAAFTWLSLGAFRAYWRGGFNKCDTMPTIHFCPKCICNLNSISV